eukprot:TRINITY_DN251_c1_g1_i6.p1 TRINITY_DN251_c1_g1~~TRINITY_DN251_c1_g1_i6.p1  ORF type:complete len:318 (-),score=129.44 TRINITY_DN251_c1_g1_i6:66-1019(-)
MNSNIPASLLKFCLEHSDGTTESVVPTRDTKDYEFLKSALNNLKNDADFMKEFINCVKNENSNFEQKLHALKELQYLVEDIDNARDFCKLGGLQTILPYLENIDHNQLILQDLVLWIISCLVQNNNLLQQQLFNIGILNKIQEILIRNQFRGSLVCRALSALSSLLKNNSQIQNNFFELNNTNNTNNVIISLIENLSINEIDSGCTMRILVILQTLITNKQQRNINYLNEIFKKLNIIDRIKLLIEQHQNVDIREKALIFLTTFIQNNKKQKKNLKQTNIKQILTNRLQIIQQLNSEQMEIYQNECDIIQQLNNILN